MIKKISRIYVIMQANYFQGLSDCAGIVVAPKIGGRLKHIEFVPVSNDKALVILVTENGMIENRIIKIPKGLPSSF